MDWLADCRAGWVHTDGTVCDEYLAPPRSTPPGGFWCTAHQMFVRHPKSPPEPGNGALASLQPVTTAT